MGQNVSPAAFSAAVMAAMIAGELPPSHGENRHGFDGYASFCMGRRRERDRDRKQGRRR